MTTAHLPIKHIATVLAVSSVMLGAIAYAVPHQIVWAQTPTPQSETPSISAAPEFLSLTAIPPRLGDTGELKAKPGGVIQTSIRVRNTSQSPVNLATSVRDFVLNEDGVTPVPVDSEVSNRWSLASWVTLSPETQRLAPNQIGTINLVINVPNDALPGGHYAMVLHEPSFAGDGSEALGNTASRVSQKVGTLVYFMVEGPINEEAFVRNLTFPKLTEFGPVPYSFTVENMSDVHIRPQISLEIFNFFNRRVETMEIETKNVFPYTPRKFEGQWNRVWGIGPYTAKLTMSYGSAGSVVVAHSKFWLIPLKIVLALIVIVLSLIALAIVIRRHVHHRLNDDKERIAELERKLEQLNDKSENKRDVE